MTTEDAVRAHFRSQAEACGRLGSPFTASLLELAADRLDPASRLGAALLGWPGDPTQDALALRFAGGLHALKLQEADPALVAVYPPHEVDPGSLWAAISLVMDQNGDWLRAWIDHPPQTNEVGRSAMLLPGLLEAARRVEVPLSILEIGASSGLNLQLDRFRYSYGSAQWGAEQASIVLSPEVRGGAPDLSGDLSIARRQGVDVRPLDPTRPEDRLRLMAYIWPDQAARLARVAAALDLATSSGVRVERADAADAVDGFAKPKNGELRLLVHTIVWQYLPATTQESITADMTAAGLRATASAPIGWLSMEPGGSGHAELRLRLWPQGIDAVLARCDYHGRWIEWLARD